MSTPSPDECLFLLEVLIDKIIFIKSPCFSDRNFKTVVSFEFLTGMTLEISDEDAPCDSTCGGPYLKEFNSGKSCLFALKPADMDKATSSFPIKVTIYKALPCDCLPTKVIMGVCEINMTKQFAAARKKYTAEPDKVSSESLKDAYRMKASDGTDTGDVLLFARISCFGKSIITKFQGSDGMATREVCEASCGPKPCTPKKDFKNMKDECGCGSSRGGGGGTSSGPCSAPVCPTEKESPCTDAEDSCYCGGSHAQASPPAACRNTDAYCLHVPKGCDGKPYEEIGATFNGNEVKIRVPKSTRKLKKLTPSEEGLQNRCNCNADLEMCPPTCGGGADGGDGPRNQMVFQVPDDMVNAATKRTPQNSEMVYSRIEQNENTCDVTPADAPRGVRARKVLHGDKDVFVLQIGRHSDEPHRDGNIEVELVTPRSPPKPKVPSHSCKQIQCTDEVEPPASAPKKGGGGKKKGRGAKKHDCIESKHKE